MQKMINEFKPAAVIVDPVSNLNAVANNSNVKTMLTRLLDQLKLDLVTTVLTILTPGYPTSESTNADISSLADTWIQLRDTEFGGERNRGMFILKSRGMAHSNQIREFELTAKGVNLLDVYVSPSGVLTGSARLSREAQEKAKDLVRQQDAQIQQLSLEKKRKAMEARIADIRAEFKTEEAEVEKFTKQEKLRQRKMLQDREMRSKVSAISRNRVKKGDPGGDKDKKP